MRSAVECKARQGIHLLLLLAPDLVSGERRPRPAALGGSVQHFHCESLRSCSSSPVSPGKPALILTTRFFQCFHLMGTPNGFGKFREGMRNAGVIGSSRSGVEPASVNEGA